LPTPGEVLAGGGEMPAPTAIPTPPPTAEASPQSAAPPTSLADIAKLAAQHGDVVLSQQIEHAVHFIALEGETLTIAMGDAAPGDLAQKIQAGLIAWTGGAWDVVLGDVGSAQPTLREARTQAIENHPLVREALKTFPGATISQVRPIQAD